MSWIKSFLAPLILILGCASGTGAESGDCGKEQALIAENSVGKISSWSDLERFFEEHESCDDGLIAEGLSDRVGFLLESNLDGFIRIANLPPKRQFRKFVINHLDETLNEDAVRSILFLAKSCRTDNEDICQELMTRAEGTLDALSNP